MAKFWKISMLLGIFVISFFIGAKICLGAEFLTDGSFSTDPASAWSLSGFTWSEENGNVAQIENDSASAETSEALGLTIGTTYNYSFTLVGDFDAGDVWGFVFCDNTEISGSLVSGSNAVSGSAVCEGTGEVLYNDAVLVEVQVESSVDAYTLDDVSLTDSGGLTEISTAIHEGVASTTATAINSMVENIPTLFLILGGMLVVIVALYLIFLPPGSGNFRIK